MLGHNLRLAWKSLRRNPVLTLLIVSGIALGICVSTTFTSARHSMAKDPLPGKSGVLYNVRLDSWDPAHGYPTRSASRPPPQITYRDLQGIVSSDIPVRRAAMYGTNLFVHPDPRVGRAFEAEVRVCDGDFFPMFDVPFEFGAGWDRAAESAALPVAVLSQATNQKLFGGEDSVGRQFRLGDRDFTVVGVIGPWRPNVRFYDLSSAANALVEPEDIFIPFALTRPMKLQNTHNLDSWGPSPAPGHEGFLASETVWIQYWVELAGRAQLAAYEEFLRGYALEQKKIGRFQRPVDNRVTPLMAWLEEQEVVPRETQTLVVVSLLFLAVSALNLTGLLLGKFLARSAEIGVRRALGATRADIFLQHIVECEVVALVGGGLGIAASWIGLRAVARLFPYGDVLGLDAVTVLAAVGLSLVAGLIAGAYPAWRICTAQPAVHLKLQ